MTSHAYITINLFNLCQHFFLPFYTYFLKCWHRLNEPYMVRCGYNFHNKYVNIVNVLSNLFVWQGYRFCLFLQFILCGRDIDFVSFYNLIYFVWEGYQFCLFLQFWYWILEFFGSVVFLIFHFIQYMYNKYVNVFYSQFCSLSLKCILRSRVDWLWYSYISNVVDSINKGVGGRGLGVVAVIVW
jgi:hypothetical protein